MANFEDLIWLFSSNEYNRGIIRMNIAEAACLYKYCKLKSNSNLVEIGRKHGGSTVLMASTLSDNGRLYSIDIKMSTNAIENTKSLSHKIEMITQDSSKLEWSLPIGLILIDGDHSFEGVKKDIDKFLPFVEKGGYVAFHDAVGKKNILQPLFDELVDKGWKKVDAADSMLVMQKV